ncbi:MAG: CGNR zinc finger domain-containing protein, partial [Pseudomonadota bacterium]|nr:CGNR zinc finger domain-containing protein [Pseudomonadota bacterium]
VHLAALARARLAPQGGRYGWSWRAREHPIEATLGPICLSALKLLQSADCGRVRQCPGDLCGWLFHDASRNGRRRWCEMQVCGNRAKQKRFAERARA